MCINHQCASDAAAGEETSAASSGRSAEHQSDVDRGSLHFSLKYDAEASALVVTVVKATGLPGGDAEAVSSYVKVRLLPDKHQKAKTKVVRRPRWYEEQGSTRPRWYADQGGTRPRW